MKSRSEGMKNIAVVLAGGQGKRMRSDSPKVLCSVLGEPMLEWVLKACENAGLEKVCVIKGFRGDMIDGYLIITQIDTALNGVDTVIKYADDLGIVLYVRVVDLVGGILLHII